jgi:hypothetical protein
MDYVERSGHVVVPKNAGIKGLLKTVEAILSEIPSIQTITIGADGRVWYSWFAPEGAADKTGLEVDFTDVLPYAVIRNTRVVEVASKEPGAQFLLLEMFTKASLEQRFPICFVAGTDSCLWRWLGMQPGVSLFGCFIYYDAEVPDDVLILCTSYARTTSITDTDCAFKITMLEVGDAK